MTETPQRNDIDQSVVFVLPYVFNFTFFETVQKCFMEHLDAIWILPLHHVIYRRQTVAFRCYLNFVFALRHTSPPNWQCGLESWRQILFLKGEVSNSDFSPKWKREVSSDFGHLPPENVQKKSGKIQMSNGSNALSNCLNIASLKAENLLPHARANAKRRYKGIW